MVCLLITSPLQLPNCSFRGSAATDPFVSRINGKSINSITTITSEQPPSSHVYRSQQINAI